MEAIRKALFLHVANLLSEIREWIKRILMNSMSIQRSATGPLTFELSSELCFHSTPEADLHVDGLRLKAFQGHKASSAVLFCVCPNRPEWFISVITLRARLHP